MCFNGNTYSHCTKGKTATWCCITIIEALYVMSPFDSSEMCSEHLEDKGTMEGSDEFLWNCDILSIHLICEIKQGTHFRVIAIWLLIQETEMFKVECGKFLTSFIQVFQVEVQISECKHDGNCSWANSVSPRVRYMYSLWQSINWKSAKPWNDYSPGHRWG